MPLRPRVPWHTRTLSASRAHKRITEAACHAPHLLDAEVGHVLRRGERAGEISEHTARTALRALPEMIDYRYPHTGRLADLAWGLRHTVTFYVGPGVQTADTTALARSRRLVIRRTSSAREHPDGS